MGMVEGPVTIAEEELTEPTFANEKDVRLRIRKVGVYQDDETGKYSFPIALLVEAEQPENPHLEQYKGFEITHWLRTDPASVRDYKEFCAAFGIDPTHPDFSGLEGASVIAQVKSNPGKVGTKNEGKVFHNVYRMQPA